MKHRWRVTIATVLAVGATLLSTLVTSEVQVAYPGSEDCGSGCAFVAAGWPRPFIVDNPGISPVGSVSLTGALLGIDLVLGGAAAIDLLVWFVAAYLLILAYERMHGH
jgi:hypothetical protein